MKKLLFLPLVLISCLCFGQFETSDITAEEIIGKPVKIGNLFVAKYDFPNTMDWNDAKNACRALGKGWRLPTKNELILLYKNKEKIGGSKVGIYWSSSDYSTDGAWAKAFSNGWQDFPKKTETLNVRAVRAL